MARECVLELKRRLLSEQAPSRAQMMGSPFKLRYWVQSTDICGRNERWSRWQLRALPRQWIEFGGSEVGMTAPPSLETYESCLWMKGKLWCSLEDGCWNRSKSYRHQRGWIFGQCRRLWTSSSLSQELLESGSCRNQSWSFGQGTSDQAALSLPFRRSEIRIEEPHGFTPWGIISHVRKCNGPTRQTKDSKNVKSPPQFTSRAPIVKTRDFSRSRRKKLGLEEGWWVEREMAGRPEETGSEG